MKTFATIISWLSIFTFLNCSSGNFKVFSIDFDEVELKTCPREDLLNATVFFKIKQKETLFITIPQGVLKNQENKDPVSIQIGSQAALYYRSFDAAITEEYFCGDIPLGEPRLEKNIKANQGSINIITSKEVDQLGIISYNHELYIKDLVLIDGENKQNVVGDSISLGFFVTKPILENEVL